MPDTEKDIFASAIAAEEPVDTGTEQEQETPAVEAETPAAEAGAQERDPATGKFVAKVADAGKPAGEVQQAAAEVAAVRKPGGEQQADHRIPLSEHLREREERQAAQRERDDLRRQLETLRRQPKEAAEPPPDWYANPDQAFSHHVQEAVDPIRNQLMYNARLIANQIDGAEMVKAASDAFDQATATGELHPSEAQRIMSNPNPFHEAVTWHKQRQALKEIGPDPAAYKTKLREDLLKDPEFLAAAVAAARAGAGGAQQQQRPANNITRLPPSLSRVTNAAPVNTGGDDADVSDRELFQTTMRSR